MQFLVSFPARTAFAIFATIVGVLNVAETRSAVMHGNRFNNSRLAGSPDPPLPYRPKKAFPGLKFRNPLYITHLPHTDRMLVVEQSQRVLSCV